MAFLQTDHHSVVRLSDSIRAAGTIRRLARQRGYPIVRSIGDAGRFLLAAVRQLGSVARRSAQRRVRARLAFAERERQRRALARLSDRELRDIGLTRYDIEFVLRQKSWR